MYHLPGTNDLFYRFTGQTKNAGHHAAILKAFEHGNYEETDIGPAVRCWKRMVNTPGIIIKYLLKIIAISVRASNVLKDTKVGRKGDKMDILYNKEGGLLSMMFLEEGCKNWEGHRGDFEDESVQTNGIGYA
jgi:hypothetical protein